MIISNVSGIHAVPIAENVFAFIFGVARGIFEARDYMKKYKWIKLEMTDRLFTLNDNKMLVLRIGSIGSQIAKVAKFHGTKTIGINLSGREVDNFDETFDTNQLPNVIGSVDFVSNTLPGTSQTRVLYDKEFFKGMNQEGYFISVGRGDAII